MDFVIVYIKYCVRFGGVSIWVSSLQKKTSKRWNGSGTRTASAASKSQRRASGTPSADAHGNRRSNIENV